MKGQRLVYQPSMCVKFSPWGYKEGLHYVHNENRAPSNQLSRKRGGEGKILINAVRGLWVEPQTCSVYVQRMFTEGSVL